MSFFGLGTSKLTRHRYYSQVLYKLKQPHEWDVIFVVVKDDPAFIKFIKEKYSDWLEGAHQIIKLKEDASYIRLQSDSRCLDQWEMSEIISSQIDREDIDYFTPEQTLHVPHCHFNFCWQSDLPVKILNMRILVEGANGPNNFFRVMLPQRVSPDDTTTVTEDIDKVPISTTFTRRTLKHSQPIKKDVLRYYHSDICTRLNVSPETLKSFSGKLFSKGIIDTTTRLSVDRTGGQSGTRTLLDYIEMRVEQKPKLLNVVLELMESEDNLCDVAKEIKGEGDKEYEVQPHGSHESYRDDPADTNSKSSYKCFWMSILGGALLIGFIAIFVGSYVPGLNEAPPVTHVSEASSSMSNPKSNILPSFTEMKERTEGWSEASIIHNMLIIWFILKNNLFTQDSMKDLKDEPSVIAYYGKENKDSYPAPTIKMDGGDILHNMKVIAEYHTEFSSDKSLSIDWDKYGCRLQIPEGSIPQGEVGTLDLYAIYNGPFQFPQDSSPVSAYYLISLSHDLQKPAILELQHCYIINNDDDAAQLTFASAATSTGPPYRFRPVDGGSFLPGRYALIHQKSFSYFNIIWQWIRQSISRLIYGMRHALSYSLIQVEYPNMWRVKLDFTKYLNLHVQCLKQEQERNEKLSIVKHESLSFALTEGIKIVSTVVFPEGQYSEDLEVELKSWKATHLVRQKNWELRASITEIHTEPVLEDSISFDIEWSGHLPPEKCVFHICLLGIKEDIRIQVKVPYGHPIQQSESSHTDFEVIPSTKIKEETTSFTQDNMKNLEDEPSSPKQTNDSLKILRRYHHKLCEILDSSEPTFRSLTLNLFSEEIIDAKTKNYLLQKVGLGADKLLDYVEKKVAAKPERMDVVLQIMDKEESLQDIVEELIKGMSNATSCILPSSTEIKGKKEETTSFAQDSTKYLKDETSVTAYYGNENKDSYPAPTKQMDGVTQDDLPIKESTTKSSILPSSTTNTVKTTENVKTTAEKDRSFIPEDENLLVHLQIISEVLPFCTHLRLPAHDCDTIRAQNPGDLGLQKVALLTNWRGIKKRTWKEFIIPFALLSKCVKAKELANEHSVYFDPRLKEDQTVLKTCKDINDHDS